MAEADVARLIRFNQIERERLKQQAAVDNITRAHVVTVRQVGIGPDRSELDRHSEGLFVAQDIELYQIAFEFPLDYFRHVDPLPFELHGCVSRDRMIVDRQKHISRLHVFGARSGRNHGADEHAAIVIL